MSAAHIDGMVRQWAEARLVVNAGVPRTGWFALSLFHQDYQRWVGAGVRSLPRNVFSMHVRAIPGIEIKRNASGSVLVGATMPHLSTEVDKPTLIEKISPLIAVGLPKRGKKITGSRQEVYIYRGALKSAAAALSDDARAKLIELADTAGEDDIKKIGRAFSKAIKRARGGE